ncbi:MAG: hypothetical protein KGH62_05790, partial [Candidatus Micrarchaeota archaeon]|nr:hypothetical protein [Candidatus Micrarchaeota archaeon]
PYTYNFLVFNTVTNTVIATNLLTSTALTLTNTLVLSSWMAGNSLGYNVIITDSASTKVTANSITKYLGFNSIPSVVLNFNQTSPITFPTSFSANAVVSGGTGPFSFNWMLNNAYDYNSLLTSNTASNTMIKPVGGLYQYNVIVIDQGTTANYILAQVTNTITVRTQTPTVSMIIYWQNGTQYTLGLNATKSFSTAGTFTLATGITTGSSPLTANFFNFSINGLNTPSNYIYSNGMYLNGNTLTASYSTTSGKSVLYCPPTGNTIYIFNATTNGAWSPFNTNVIINETSAVSCGGGQSGGGGGGGGGGAGFLNPLLNVLNQTNATLNVKPPILNPSSVAGNSQTNAILALIFGYQVTYGTANIPAWEVVAVALAAAATYLFQKKDRTYKYYAYGFIVIGFFYLVYIGAGIGH